MFVNGRFLTRPITGVERYALELLVALDNLDGGVGGREVLTPRVLHTDAETDRLRSPTRVVGRWSGHRWEQLELPAASAGRPLLNLCNLAPVARRRQVTVIHDAAVFAVPETFSTAFRTAYRVLLPLVAARAQHLVTVSVFSQGELSKHLGISSRRISVVSPGVDHFDRVVPDPSVLKSIDASRPFVLMLGSLNPRKNLAGLAAAATLLPDIQFVLGGGANPSVYSTWDGHLPSNVRPLGYVSDGELSALFGRASCFVFPSFYEGFGLPPLEAMRAGCPAVVARAASLPEVCGDAALYFEPHEPQDIAAQIRRVVRDTALQQELRERGRRRTARYTWRRAAESMTAVLEEAFR